MTWKNETDFDSGDVEHARAELFVNSILPRDRVLKVLDIKAGEQRFGIRRPNYVVGVDVLQAERGRRSDADEHRVMDLEQVEIESMEYDVAFASTSSNTPATRSLPSPSFGRR